MKLTHIHQTHKEKPLVTCLRCKRFIFHDRWVVELSGKRALLCEDCVNEARKEADRIFMQTVKRYVIEAKEGKA